MEKANSEIINLITNRRSHRKYINKKIPKDIIETIINCGRNAPFGGNPKPDCQVTEYIVIEDRQQAIHYALEHAEAHDIILCLGKGHEDYQILDEEPLPFSERQIIEEYFQQED